VGPPATAPVLMPRKPCAPWGLGHELVLEEARTVLPQHERRRSGDPRVTGELRKEITQVDDRFDLFDVARTTVSRCVPENANRVILRISLEDAFQAIDLGAAGDQLVLVKNVADDEVALRVEALDIEGGRTERHS
jgi:hypothetical protein